VTGGRHIPEPGQSSDSAKQYVSPLFDGFNVDTSAANGNEEIIRPNPIAMYIDF
jgi:hypothetical protein